MARPKSKRYRVLVALGVVAFLAAFGIALAAAVFQSIKQVPSDLTFSSVVIADAKLGVFPTAEATGAQVNVLHFRGAAFQPPLSPQVESQTVFIKNLTTGSTASIAEAPFTMVEPCRDLLATIGGTGNQVKIGHISASIFDLAGLRLGNTCDRNVVVGLNQVVRARVHLGLVSGLATDVVYSFPTVFGAVGELQPSPNYPQTPVGTPFTKDFNDNAFPSDIFEEDNDPIYWTTRLVPGRITISNGTAKLSNSMSDWDGNRLTSGGIRSFAYYGYGDLVFRLKASEMSGIITALYLYVEDKDLSEGGVHDEIDVELSSFRLGEASLVIYNKAPGGLDQDDGSNRIAGGIINLRAVSGLAGFSSTNFHIWEISYRATEVIWYVDGIQVYRLTRAVPTAKMQIFFNTYYSQAWTDFSGPLGGLGTAELDSISFTSVQ